LTTTPGLRSKPESGGGSGKLVSGSDVLKDLQQFLHQWRVEEINFGAHLIRWKAVPLPMVLVKASGNLFAPVCCVGSSSLMIHQRTDPPESDHQTK